MVVKTPLVKTPFDKDIILYEIFIKTYQDLAQDKISLNSQIELENSIVKLSRDIGLDYFNKMLVAMKYARRLFRSQPSPKVHKNIMSYRIKVQKATKKQREEFLTNKMYVFVKKICRRYPSIAVDILSSFENDLLEELEILKEEMSRFRRIKMLKLIAIRRVRAEVVK